MTNTKPCPQCKGEGAVKLRVPIGEQKWTCGECLGLGTVPIRPLREPVP